MADTSVPDDISSAKDMQTAVRLQEFAQQANPSLPKGSGMFAPSTDSFASSTKVYMENRRDELVHEIDAVHEVSALFMGMSSQVDELIKCLAVQVNAIAEEAQNAAHKALRGQGVKILKLAYLDQLEQANVFMKAHIQDCSSAAGMVMYGANRKYKSQAAEVVKLRNELRKALLGDNPGWEVERMKMKREARDHNRAMKKLQNENEQMKKELDDLGVVREAEKSELSISMDAEVAKLERTTDKMWKNRRLAQTWIQWQNHVHEARLSKKEEKAAAAAQRQELQQEQLKQQLEKLQAEHHKLQIEAAAASASKGGKPIVIPPPPAPVIIEAPPPKKVETVDASTQASQPVAVSAPPKVEVEEEEEKEFDASPVRDVRQTDDFKEAMAMQASRRKAHKENVALRMCAGRIVRNKAAFFREWRRKVEDNKRTNQILMRSIKRYDNARASEAFYHWLKMTEELKGWADGQYERHLVRRYFEQFREKTLKREVDDAIKNLKGYIEQPLMKVVAVACQERELRGDLEVILEECLALLVRCMKGGVDSDQGLQGRLRNQIGWLLDARWIIRNRTTDKVAGGGAAPFGELPAKPWEEWDEAGGRSRRTTDSERRGAYQDFDDLRQKHAGLPVSLRHDAGKIPKDEMLPQPEGADPPATMVQRQGGSGMSIMVGDWEMEKWEEGWVPFKELTDAIGMVLSSIGKCPPVEFWRGFWSSWARFASDEASRSGAGELMDTLENGPKPSFTPLPAAPPEPAAAAAAEPPAPVAPPVDGLPSSLATFLNQQPGRPTTGKGRHKGRGNPGPPMLYASSKRPSRSAAPVRPPTSGAPFGAEAEPGTASISSGAGSGIRFSVRIPTGPEPLGGKSRNQSPTPDLLLMDAEIAGWGQEDAPVGLSRTTTPSPDQASPFGRRASTRQSAVSDLDSDPSNINLNMSAKSKGGPARSSDSGNMKQEESLERMDMLDNYVELIKQEAAAGGSGDHAMHRQRPSTAAVHGRQTGAAAHMDDAQPSLRQGQARPLQPTTQRGGGNLPVHVVRPSTAQPRLAPGVTRQGAAPAPFTERKQRPSSAMGTHPKREAVTKAGHPPKRPTSAMGNQHSAQAPSQSGPGSQSSGAAWKADPSTPRLQQERPPARKGGQGHGQESEATSAYKPSLAEVIPERTAGAAETAKSCRPSMSARKRQGVLMMTLG